MRGRGPEGGPSPEEMGEGGEQFSEEDVEAGIERELPRQDAIDALKAEPTAQEGSWLNKMRKNPTLRKLTLAAGLGAAFFAGQRGLEKGTDAYEIWQEFKAGQASMQEVMDKTYQPPEVPDWALTQKVDPSRKKAEKPPMKEVREVRESKKTSLNDVIQAYERMLHIIELKYDLSRAFTYRGRYYYQLNPGWGAEEAHDSVEKSFDKLSTVYNAGMKTQRDIVNDENKSDDERREAARIVRELATDRVSVSFLEGNFLYISTNTVHLLREQIQSLRNIEQ